MIAQAMSGTDTATLFANQQLAAVRLKKSTQLNALPV